MTFPDLNHFLAHAEELVRDAEDPEALRQHILRLLPHACEKIEDAEAELEYWTHCKEQIESALAYLPVKT